MNAKKKLNCISTTTTLELKQIAKLNMNHNESSKTPHTRSKYHLICVCVCVGFGFWRDERKALQFLPYLSFRLNLDREYFIFVCFRPVWSASKFG